MKCVTLKPHLQTPPNIIINDDLFIIGINGKIFDLHEKVKLYKLLKIFLINQNQIVSKQEIFSEIWPDEKFLPRTHTPRIYDIIKRIKNLCNEVEFTITNSKQGYEFKLI